LICCLIQSGQRGSRTQWDVSLQVPGRHNVRNALAVLAIVDVLGLSREKAAKALAEFTGAGRRFQLRGEVNGISIFDDYAHHPTEIMATLEGARARYPEAADLGRLAAAHLLAHKDPLP
jgi:UDP-N-acetylmuramate--alanine ligase